MIDRKQIKIGEQVDRLGASDLPTDVQEGAILCSVNEGGIAKVTIVAAPAGREVIAGVSILPYLVPTQAVSEEQFVVPASGSLIFNLRNPLGVSGSKRAIVVGGSDLAVDVAAFSATPATGTVKWDVTGGRLKFAAGDAGKTVKFIYRFNLTVTQARMRYQERSINNRDLVGELNQLGVAKGYIEISTDQFDPNQDYTTGAPLQLGPNGIITIGGSGPLIPNAQVLNAPDLSGSLQGAFLRFSALIG